MNAVLLHTHGDAQKLIYSEYPIPVLKTDEVLVKLSYAALNRMDLWVRNGWPGLKLDYPHILGADGAGIIEEIGEGVENWKPGDRVVINSNIGCGDCEFCLNKRDNLCTNWHLLGETLRGTYADYISVPSRQLLKVPDKFPLAESAASGLVYHTAWHSLVTRGNIKRGEKILIVGASGGVNTASIQIARYFGAEVYVVGSTDEKLALAKSLGAHHLINRNELPNWAKEVFIRSDKSGMDIVVDNVGTTFPMSFRSAKKGGKILTVGNTGGPKFEIDNRFIFGKQLSILGSTMGTLEDFESVMSLVFSGDLKVSIGNYFPLERASDAHSILEKGEQLGKIVLEIEN